MCISKSQNRNMLLQDKNFKEKDNRNSLGGISSFTLVNIQLIVTLRYINSYSKLHLLLFTCTNYKKHARANIPWPVFAKIRMYMNLII